MTRNNDNLFTISADVADRLQRIRIVMVEPSHPGNIGAAARAMKTMGLKKLCLVKPPTLPDPQATAMAAGAGDLVEQAEIYPNLAQALDGCSAAWGCSARPRRLVQQHLLPREAALQSHALLAQAEPGAAPKTEVAVVFGRERTGLTNAELDCCTGLLHIPANTDYSSLNVAAAVQVMAYELRSSALFTQATDLREHCAEQRKMASAEQMQSFYQHLQQSAEMSGFLDPEKPKFLMRRLRQIFNRSQPDESEINLLRGMLVAYERAAKRD